MFPSPPLPPTGSSGEAETGNPDPGCPGKGRGPEQEAEEAEDAEGAGYDGPLADDPAWTAPGRPVHFTGPAPLPAVINLIVPAATLFGWGTAPTQAGSWGLLDCGETRAVVTAASRHQATRWCVTLTNETGQAVAHACASGSHPWNLEDLPAPDDPPDSPAPPDHHDPPDHPDPDGSTPTSSRQARLRAMLTSLNLTFEPVVQDTCDHAHAEDRYTPSRKLRHLIRARTIT